MSESMRTHLQLICSSGECGVNLVEDCQPLVAKYPGIMLAPYGSYLSPGATDVSDR